MTIATNHDFDPDAARVSFELVRQIVARYFRLEVIGEENLPRGRGLIVGCHSGVIPYDAALTLVAIHQATGRFARALGDRIFGRLNFVDTFLRRRGAMVGNRAEATEVVRAGNLLLVFPGGTADMTRPIWRAPYRVLPHKGFAPGRGGYVKVALRTRSPIIPLAVVGAEEAHMLLADIPPLARLLRIPLFPLVAFPFPLPVKIYVRFGRPIHLEGGSKMARDQAIVDRLNARVRAAIQALIDDTLRRRRGLIWSAYDGHGPSAHRQAPGQRRRRSRKARTPDSPGA